MCCVSFLSFSFHGFYALSFFTPNLVTAVGAETEVSCVVAVLLFIFYKKMPEKNLCIFQGLLLYLIHRCYKYMLSVWDSFCPYWSAETGTYITLTQKEEVNSTAVFVHKTSYLYAGQKILSACWTLTH